MSSIVTSRKEFAANRLEVMIKAMKMIKKPIPFSFVLDELENSSIGHRIQTKPMFGARAIYVDDLIVLILRQKDDSKTKRDNGVWVVAHGEHLESLQKDFPSLRPIEIFEGLGGKAITAWRNLPDSADDFEEAAFELVRLVIKHDPRIGKIPESKKKSLKSKKKKTVKRKKK